MRFYGSIEAKADAKGRIFLPSVFRKTLAAGGEEKLYLRKDIFQPCLVLYPKSVWDAQIDLIAKRTNRYNMKQKMVMRQFLADSLEICLDGNGRMLVPKRYMNLAQIKQEVVFMGIDDTIEIWAKENTESPFMDSEEFALSMQEIMSNDEGGDDE